MALGGGWAGGLPKRAREEAAPVDDGRDDGGEAAAGARVGGTLRESTAAAVRAADEGSERALAAALSSRARPGRLRVGASGAARRGGAAFGFVDRAAARKMAAGVRTLEEPTARRALPSGRLGVRASPEAAARGRQRA